MPVKSPANPYKFLVCGKITTGINCDKHKAVHTFLDNMFRSVSRRFSCCVLVLDLTRSGSRNMFVIQKCVFYFVLVTYPNNITPNSLTQHFARQCSATSRAVTPHHLEHLKLITPYRVSPNFLVSSYLVQYRYQNTSDSV